MRVRLRRRLLLTAPILIALGVLIANWRGGVPAAPSAQPAAALEPRYVLDEGRWTRYAEDGQPKFRASAQRIQYFDDDSARLRSVELNALGGAGSPWRISAPEAYVPPDSKKMELLGSVTAVANWPEGETVNFQTPKLWIDEAARELYTDTAVQMRGRSRSADADGLRAAWVGKSVELQGRVRMEYANPN